MSPSLRRVLGVASMFVLTAGGHSPIAMRGLPPAVLAGGGGEVSNDSLVIHHNSGFTLFNQPYNGWEADNIMQLQLKGRSFSFMVDLKHVHCACNLALYLISMPARGWDGKPSHGGGGGQPPYYCDANKVGGQWCPEIDIMEANTHAFQVTPHKCHHAHHGHYKYCDRGGCHKSTRDIPHSYGPGHHYTIDSRKPFGVVSEFHMNGAGVFSGMRTILVQNHKKVTLDLGHCGGWYFEKLNKALTEGISLRITYWGGSAESMAWLDTPPCGGDWCEGSHATIRDMGVEELYTTSPGWETAVVRKFAGVPAMQGEAGFPWAAPLAACGGLMFVVLGVALVRSRRARRALRGQLLASMETDADSPRPFARRPGSEGVEDGPEVFELSPVRRRVPTREARDGM